MLTRLKVNGFKNLVDVDVRFGPFTCIAGVNGSGKSSLFDAIRFLAALAEKPLVEAALSVRGVESSADIRSLFHRVGDHSDGEMSFEAEMIVPAEGTDDLGQPVRAAATFLQYSLTLTYQGYASTRPKNDGTTPSKHGLRIVREQLISFVADEARQHISFEPGMGWLDSAVRGTATEHLIETRLDPRGESTIRLSYEQDIQPRRTHVSRAGQLPRSVLSRVEGDQSPTAVLAQQEMRSWRVFELNPAAIRYHGFQTDPPGVADDGTGVVPTLYTIANMPPASGRDAYEAQTAVYARVANRIRRLIGDVWEITVEPVNSRGELELNVSGRDGTTHSIRLLSDGTLRFLALAVIEEEQEPGVLCIEEPENGIHPGRIQALLDLLQGIAMDTRYHIEEGNPLRQVIISTHSPSVVMRVPEDSLVMAELWPSHDDRGSFKRARFRGLGNTWRDPSPDRHSLALGTLLNYLNPEGYRPLPEPDPEHDSGAQTRVMDRADLHRILSPLPQSDA